MSAVGHAAAWQSALSDDEKIGQLLIPRPLRGARPADYLDAFAAGGLIVSSRLTDEPETMARFISEAQDRAHARNGIPLAIAADHEGGQNRILRGNATEVPSNMALGATADPSAARAAATILAREARGAGINWILAPVADVNTDPLNPVIGTRSYGDDPAAVAAFVREAVAGFQEAGVLACAKHFPGHGDTDVDSHADLPTVRADSARLESCELVPFRAAIEAGVDSVMTAHVMVPALDPERMGTLSRRILREVLREKLGFSGIVITDAMEMRGIADRWDPGEAAIETVLAGSDVILTHSSVDACRPVYDALRAALRSGRLPLERLDEALGRLLAAKAQLAESAAHPVDRSREHAEAALALARRSITLVRDRVRALPLPRALGDRLLVVVPTGSQATLMDQWTAAHSTLAREIATLAPGAIDVEIAFPASEEERRTALRAAGRAEVIVAGTLNAHLDPAQVELLEALRDACSGGMVLVGLRTPYDAARLAWADTYLCAYTSVTVAMRALAETLFGLNEPRGRLPVRVD